MTLGLLTAVFGGSFFGAFLGPLLLEEYRSFQTNRRWKAPRKKLLEERLANAAGEGWVSIGKLSRLVGLSDDDCRSLLIEIQARGGTMKSQKEAWALISRQPLDQDPFDKDETST